MLLGCYMHAYSRPLLVVFECSTTFHVHMDITTHNFQSVASVINKQSVPNILYKVIRTACYQMCTRNAENNNNIYRFSLLQPTSSKIVTTLRSSKRKTYCSCSISVRRISRFALNVNPHTHCGYRVQISDGNNLD